MLPLTSDEINAYDQHGIKKGGIMVKKRLMVTGLIILLAMGTVAAGCRHHSTPEDKVERIVGYLTDDMELTTEQTELLDQLKSDVILQWGKIRPARNNAHDIIMAQIKSDVMDQEQVMAAVNGVRTEVGAVIALTISRLAEFHRTLTPEQKTQLIEQLEDLKKLHGCRD